MINKEITSVNRAKICTLLEIIIFACSFALFMNLCLDLIFVELGIGAYLPQTQADDQFNNSIGILVLESGILVPLLEEIVFRNGIYRWLRKIIKGARSIAIAALVSAMLFAIYHMDIINGIYAFFAGVILSLLYEYKGKLAGCYLFHMSANIFIILIVKSEIISGVVAKLICCILSAVIAYVAGIKLKAVK